MRHLQAREAIMQFWDLCNLLGKTVLTAVFQKLLFVLKSLIYTFSTVYFIIYFNWSIFPAGYLEAYRVHTEYHFVLCPPSLSARLLWRGTERVQTNFICLKKEIEVWEAEARRKQQKKITM